MTADCDLIEVNDPLEQGKTIKVNPKGMQILDKDTQEIKESGYIMAEATQKFLDSALNKDLKEFRDKAGIEGIKINPMQKQCKIMQVHTGNCLVCDLPLNRKYAKVRDKQGKPLLKVEVGELENGEKAIQTYELTSRESKQQVKYHKECRKFRNRKHGKAKNKIQH